MTHIELREWRIARNLTQQKLSELLLLPSSKTLENWEQGIRGFPPYLPLALREIERGLKSVVT